VVAAVGRGFGGVANEWKEFFEDQTTLRENDGAEGDAATSVPVDDVDVDDEAAGLVDAVDTFSFGASMVISKENVNFVAFSFSARCEVLGGVRSVIVEGRWATSKRCWSLRKDDAER
jgi:hypothetical protein